MKKMIFTMVLAFEALNAAGASSPAARDDPPTRYVIGLSPFLPDQHKDEVYRRIIAFLLEDVPLGSSLLIYDAYSLTAVTRIDMPALDVFRAPKTRANQFKNSILELKHFLAARHEKPAFPTNAAGAPLEQAIRFPQFLDFISENLVREGESLEVLLVGSPLYVDPKEPGFSMLAGYFPSDGHLLATREQSVFGVKSRARSLEGVAVHQGWFGDPWVTELHRDKIQRFWTLYLQAQGARLGAFCGDLATVFEAVRSKSRRDEARRGRHEIDPSDSKIQMLRITRGVGMTDWITRDAPANLATTAPGRTVGPMKIGIRWKGNIDLDLYATPRENAEMLFFDHVRSPEGYYFKDHRSSPDREYEFIEFEAPVDLWRVEAKINFYEGAAPEGPSGEIRVEFDGRIYSSPFTIPAPRGNQGRSGPRQTDFWTVIDIPKLLKLRDPAPDPGFSPAR